MVIAGNSVEISQELLNGQVGVLFICIVLLFRVLKTKSCLIFLYDRFHE